MLIYLCMNFTFCNYAIFRMSMTLKQRHTFSAGTVSVKVQYNEIYIELSQMHQSLWNLLSKTYNYLQTTAYTLVLYNITDMLKC